MIEPADIRRLLDAFENSDWEEIRLSLNGTEVLISASDTPTSLPDSRGASVDTTDVTEHVLPASEQIAEQAAPNTTEPLPATSFHWPSRMANMPPDE